MVTVDDGKGGTASAAVTIRVVAPPAAAAPAPPPPSPRFPWPPPRWTARTDLSLSLVQQQTTDTNQTILDRINSAFGNAHYPDWSVYPLSDGGFAVVAQMETIDDTGRRLPGQDAWLEDPPWTLADGFGAILRRLFSADHGHYRIVVILLTTLDVVSSRDTPSDAIRALPTVGSHTLPGTVASSVPMPSARLYALIYEFKKASGEVLGLCVLNVLLLLVASMTFAFQSTEKAVDILAESALYLGPVQSVVSLAFGRLFGMHSEA